MKTDPRQLLRSIAHIAEILLNTKTKVLQQKVENIDVFMDTLQDSYKLVLDYMKFSQEFY